MFENRWVIQSNKKQTTMACLTAEAEYFAAGRCCAQILWIKNHLLDYDMSFLKTPSYYDNTSAIKKIQNPVQHSKTKNINIHHHFIRDVVHKGKEELFYISSTDQLANITKALDERSLKKLIVELGMLSMV